MSTTIHFHRASEYLKKPDGELAAVLAGLAAHHGKDGCFPAGETLIELYRRATGIDISLSTLWRKLGTLELGGWITRIRRHVRGPDGQLEMHSTLYWIKRRTWGYLRRMQGAVQRALGHRPQPPQKSAVAETAQYLRPTQDHLPALPRKEPPAEWKNMIDRLRRGKI